MNWLLLPHAPTRPNPYAPTDITLGYLGGILVREVADGDAALKALRTYPASTHRTLGKPFSADELLAALHDPGPSPHG